MQAFDTLKTAYSSILAFRSEANEAKEATGQAPQNKADMVDMRSNSVRLVMQV